MILHSVCSGIAFRYSGMAIPFFRKLQRSNLFFKETCVVFFVSRFISISIDVFFLDNSLDNQNVQQLTAYLIHNYIDNSLSTVVVEGVRRASLYCCGALGFILQVFFF